MICAHPDPVGVEIQGVYDGVLYWYCPACKTAWHRFPEETRQHEAAKQYVNQKET